MSLDLGSDILRVTDGSGVFLITPADVSTGTQGGLSGQFEVTVEVNIPGVTLEGVFALKINQLPDPVVRDVELGGETLSLDLPAGA